MTGAPPSFPGKLELQPVAPPLRGSPDLAVVVGLACRDQNGEVILAGIHLQILLGGLVRSQHHLALVEHDQGIIRPAEGSRFDEDGGAEEEVQGDGPGLEGLLPGVRKVEHLGSQPGEGFRQRQAGHWNKAQERIRVDGLVPPGTAFSELIGAGREGLQSVGRGGRGIGHSSRGSHGQPCVFAAGVQEHQLHSLGWRVSKALNQVVNSHQLVSSQGAVRRHEVVPVVQLESVTRVKEQHHLRVFDAPGEILESLIEGFPIGVADPGMNFESQIFEGLFHGNGIDLSTDLVAGAIVAVSDKKGNPLLLRACHDIHV